MAQNIPTVTMMIMGMMLMALPLEGEDTTIVGVDMHPVV
jgi:hypothetical protein